MSLRRPSNEAASTIEYTSFLLSRVPAFSVVLLDSVSHMQVSAEAARRFLVARQLLAPARTLEGGPDAVLEFLRRFGSIQFDPIAVAGRSHDLVLHARRRVRRCLERPPVRTARPVRGGQQGTLFVLMRDYPWFRGTSSLRSSRLLAESAEVAERVLERVRADGPLSALDFERERGAAIDWFG